MVVPLPTIATGGGPPEAAREAAREKVCKRLEASDDLTSDDPLFWHGRCYDGPLEAPKCTWRCEKPPRDDHHAPKWLTASEFQDAPPAAEAKVRQLAELVRLSRKTVAYTGAGISAAVVGQAARSGTNVQGFKPEPKKAQPTFTHHALGLLGQRGLIHSWVQQNHDGLPQKAGFPQECINEIHGSWYDPGNPVVKYTGSLHERAYPWMEDDSETADLVLVLGTSLGGLTADCVATDTAGRATGGRDSALGTVCINLQQTEKDGVMSLRCFGKSDDILQALLRELGFGGVKLLFRSPTWPATRRALVPYDASGVRLPPGKGQKGMWLDLSDGCRIQLTPGHNIQGAKQPQFMHIGAAKPVTHNGETKQPGKGLGVVTRRQNETSSYILTIDGAVMHLGLWWLEAAVRGGPEVLPVVNVNPRFEVMKD